MTGTTRILAAPAPRRLVRATGGLLVAVVVGAACLLPVGAARGDADPGTPGTPTPTIEKLTFEETEQQLVVVLTGEGTFPAPRVRSAPGSVRLWLPDYYGAARIRRAGDGHRIRRVLVRPGAEQSALVQISVAGGRELPPDAIDVDRQPGRTRIALPKSALPTPPPPAPEPPPAAPAKAAARLGAAEQARAATSTSRGSSASADTAAAPAPGDGMDAPGEPGAAGDASAAPASGAARPGGTLSPESDDRFPWEAPASGGDGAEETDGDGGDDVVLGSASGDPSGMTGPLLLLTLVLGAIYGAVRFLQSRNPAVAVPSDIAVVASKRLGPKHQLVLVRAMGKDHLLSIQGTTTQRLGTAPSPDPAELEASFEIPDLEEQAAAMSLARRGPERWDPAGGPSPARRGRRARDDDETAAATGPAEDDDDGPGLSPAALQAVSARLAEAEREAGLEARGRLGGRRYADLAGARGARHGTPEAATTSSDDDGSTPSGPGRRGSDSAYPADDLESRFGAKLFEFALHQSAAASEPTEGDDDEDEDDEDAPLLRGKKRRRSRRSAPGESEAVAGLLRLRQRTGS
ncbi:MAG TPA: flagellar biosynthetic protein FliO [Polyangiaceae bacterium LLY-WYZ-14_1]|nr:flagellar biosynthetic protein FliO [Polyangiaceae bacterium LLY-WYZ-14_1]